MVTFNCEQAKNNLDMAMSCYNIVQQHLEFQDVTVRSVWPVSPGVDGLGSAIVDEIQMRADFVGSFRKQAQD